MLDRGRGFSRIVYQLLVVEKRLTMEQAATGVGLGYDALHARVHGRTLFSADEVAKLIAVLPDPRLVSYLLNQSRFIAIERVEQPLSDPEDEIFRATHRILIEAADVLEAVDDALKDRRIDHREALSIQKEIEIAERALVSLREHVRSLT